MFGIAGALLSLRDGPVPQSRPAEATRFWWPDRSHGWIVAGLWAMVLPVGLFFYAALSFSPEAVRITDAKGGIQAVSVEKVVSSEYVRKKNTRHYRVIARVSVPFDSGAQSEKVEFSSEYQVASGDRVWALFASSSENLGVLVNSDREALEEKTGGSARGPVLVAALVMTAFCLFLAGVFGGFSRVSRSLRRPLKKGLCRSLAVTVRSVDVVMDSTTDTKGVVTTKPKPRLALEGRAGECPEVLLDPLLDPSHLSPEVEGRQAKLYWVKMADRPGPRRARAVLVLDGQRCLKGVLRVAADSDRPEGSPVPAVGSLPEGDGLRAIRTYPTWHPGLHAEGLWYLQAGVVALGLVAFGVGRWATFILCICAYGALFMARMVTKDNRARYLESFLPGGGPEAGP
ncbi:hypothetical protein [Streptomyces sp. NPDC048638]|uniref:hypothetical protein n=1 Tax=Streptomyces sp. NPDC048638 TaxID=3365580 RepID=UPI00371AC211